MTITAAKFTPEVLLSAPRRSSAVPNPSGTQALYTGKLAPLILIQPPIAIVVYQPF